VCNCVIPLTRRSLSLFLGRNSLGGLKSLIQISNPSAKHPQAVDPEAAAPPAHNNNTPTSTLSSAPPGVPLSSSALYARGATAKPNPVHTSMLGLASSPLNAMVRQQKTNNTRIWIDIEKCIPSYTGCADDRRV